jgi:hypothetical protein
LSAHCNERHDSTIGRRVSSRRVFLLAARGLDQQRSAIAAHLDDVVGLFDITDFNPRVPSSSISINARGDFWLSSVTALSAISTSFRRFSHI